MPRAKSLSAKAPASRLKIARRQFRKLREIRGAIVGNVSRDFHENRRNSPQARNAWLWRQSLANQSPPVFLAALPCSTLLFRRNRVFSYLPRAAMRPNLAILGGFSVINRRLASKRNRIIFRISGIFFCRFREDRFDCRGNLKYPRTERIGSSPLRFAFPRSVTARRASDNPFNYKFQLLKASRQQGVT